MFPYFVLFLVIIIWGMVCNPKERISERVLFIVPVFALMIALASVRDVSVGVDTEMYCRSYKLIGAMGWSSFGLVRFEPAFTFLCLLLNQFSSNYQLLICATALLIYAPIGYAIARYSDNCLMSTYMFVALTLFTSYMNIMRQGIAVAFVLLAFFALVRRKKIVFVLLVLFASLFHSSALVFLLLLPLSFVPFRRKYIVAYCLLCVMAVAATELYSALAKLLLGKEQLYNPAYTGSNYFGAVIQAFFGCFFILLCVNYIEVRKENGIKSYYYDLIEHALFLWLLFLMLGIKIEIFARLGYYFQILVIFAVPLALKAPGRVERIVVGSFLCLLAFGYFVAIGLLRPEWQGVVPYVANIGNTVFMFGELIS